jgi:hypothetical protein
MVRAITNWDDLPPEVDIGGEIVSTRVLEHQCRNMAAEVERLNKELEKLATGNLSAQHAAAKENQRLRDLLHDAVSELVELQSNYCDAVGAEQSMNGVALCIEMELYKTRKGSDNDKE